MPNPQATPDAASPAPASPQRGSAARARLRLLAVVLLALLTVGAAGSAIRLYFAASVDPVLTSLVAVLLAVVALGYGVLTWAVFRQRRVRHVLAIVWCAAAAVLTVMPNLQWIDVVFLVVNAVAALALVFCIPRPSA